MAMFGKRLAGAGYVVLNVIRVMNIIVLLAVIAASSVMLVKTFNNNTFFFFDALEHVIRTVICGFLIITELPLFKQYISRTWPLFGPSSGFVMLGLSMILVGNSVLANLNKDEASQEKLGLPFWRLVIASGIVVDFMGGINILASYIFRDSKVLTARQVRSDGATASHKAELESSVAASTPKPSRRSRYRSFFLRSGNENEKRNSLPSYHADAISRSNTTAGMTQNNHAFGSNYSTNGHVGLASPYNVQGSMKHVPVSPSSKYSAESPRMPDPAHHPAMIGRPF